MEEEPKTHSARRTVTLPRSLTEEIAASLAERGAKGEPDAHVCYSPV